MGDEKDSHFPFLLIVLELPDAPSSCACLDFDYGKVRKGKGTIDGEKVKENMKIMKIDL